VVLAIWQAVRRAVRRDLGTLQSIRLNHFFLFVALMIWGALVVDQPPTSAYPFLLLLGLLVLFPISSDPLAKIPAVRLEIWPVSERDRFRLRMASLALSPVVWFTLLLAVVGRPGLAAAFLAAGVAAQALVAGCERMTRRRPRWNGLAFVPPIPGRLGGLVRNHVRQMLSVLDVYAALALSAGGTAYRVWGTHPDRAAFPILALLVALALSTGAQCLFGLDSAAAMTRYRLLPLRGWQILLAKDLAVLGVLLVLVLPLSVLPGMTFGLTALGIGHFASVAKPLPQKRWRFLGGRMMSGVPQAVLGFALGFTESQGKPWLAGAAAMAWLASLAVCGERWERRHGRR
jgi:hypothetical protein